MWCNNVQCAGIEEVSGHSTTFLYDGFRKRFTWYIDWLVSLFLIIRQASRDFADSALGQKYPVDFLFARQLSSLGLIP